MEKILNLVDEIEKQTSRVILAICILTPVVMLVWQSIYVDGYNQLHFSDTCEFKMETSLDCVFCGGTRAVNAFLAKDIVSSGKYNGFFLAALVSCVLYAVVYVVNYGRHRNHIILAYELFTGCMNVAIFHTIFKNYSNSPMTMGLSLALLGGTVGFMLACVVLCRCTFIRVMLDAAYVYVVLYFMGQLDLIAISDDLVYLSSFTNCARGVCYILVVRGLLMIAMWVIREVYKRHFSNEEYEEDNGVYTQTEDNLV